MRLLSSVGDVSVMFILNERHVLGQERQVLGGFESQPICAQSTIYPTGVKSYEWGDVNFIFRQTVV